MGQGVKISYKNGNDAKMVELTGQVTKTDASMPDIVDGAYVHLDHMDKTVYLVVSRNRWQMWPFHLEHTVTPRAMSPLTLPSMDDGFDILASSSSSVGTNDGTSTSVSNVSNSNPYQ